MIAAERGAKGLELIGIAARHGQPSTLRRQRVRDGRPEAARSNGDKRGHTREVEHHAISFASASMSSMVTTLVTLVSGEIRLTIGPRTFPPSSTNSSTPASDI